MVRAINTSLAAQHGNPVPQAAIHRGMLITSAILGKDLENDEYPADKGHQIALAFDYLEEILCEGGAGLQDVVKVDLYFADKNDRVLANDHWLRLWPDEKHRPARQAHQAVLPDGCCFQIVAMAMPDQEI